MDAMGGGCLKNWNGRRPFRVQGAPVACLSFESVSGEVGQLMLARGESTMPVAFAHAGMLVRKHPLFPAGEEAGRVGNGVGMILNPDAGLGNVTVYWEDDGDTTLWTRASLDGFDLVIA